MIIWILAIMVCTILVIKWDEIVPLAIPKNFLLFIIIRTVNITCNVKFMNCLHHNLFFRLEFQKQIAKSICNVKSKLKIFVAKTIIGTSCCRFLFHNIFT